MSAPKKTFIQDLFSSDSSDETPRRTKTSESDNAAVRLRVGVSNRSDSDSKYVSRGGSSLPSIEVSPDGFTEVSKTKISTICHNAVIQYETEKGKFIKSKYFKKYDPIAGTIILGFYTHNKRNYSEAISNIKKIFAQTQISGGVDLLKDTIELQKDQWKTLRRDMIISYEKDSSEYVYKAKFNSFIKGADGSSKMSLTSERGYNYVANPQKINKIHRHMSGNDKTLTFILEALRKLEGRIRHLEGKTKK